MAGFDIEPNKIWSVRIPGMEEKLILSAGYHDHAVRYPEHLGWLDHIVTFTPLRDDDYEDEDIEPLVPERVFLGAKIVEFIVTETGLPEIYPSRVIEPVYEDYLQQQTDKLGKDIDNLFGE